MVCCCEGAKNDVFLTVSTWWFVCVCWKLSGMYICISGRCCTMPESWLVLGIIYTLFSHHIHTNTMSTCIVTVEGKQPSAVLWGLGIFLLISWTKVPVVLIHYSSVIVNYWLSKLNCLFSSFSLHGNSLSPSLLKNGKGMYSVRYSNVETSPGKVSAD